MSQTRLLSDPKNSDGRKEHIKCRIPQRTTHKQAVSVPTGLPKPKPLSEITQKVKYEMQHSRFSAKNNVRPRENVRLKSASKAKDVSQRTPRQEIENITGPPKKTSTTIAKKVFDDNLMSSSYKSTRPVIKVPVAHKQTPKSIHTTKNVISAFPDQETISKCEELELKQANIDGDDQELNNDGSFTSPQDKVMRLQIRWQDELVQFEKLSSELRYQQKHILELYAKMIRTHEKMASLGHMTSLPPSEDMGIINVSKFTPEQLLKLCAYCAISPNIKTDKEDMVSGEDTIQTEVDKIQNMIYKVPQNLIATCEQTLIKRKEIIDWFDSLKTVEKGITMKTLSKKINDFNAENEMLSGTLNKVKNDFLIELSEVVSIMRKNMSDTITLRLYAEQQTCEISELNAKNEDLKKQLRNTEYLRSQTNKKKIEELEKQLKEEKSKKELFKNRLIRAEGQIKIGVERSTQLESALANAQTYTQKLEQAIQQLEEKNQKLQEDFAEEIDKLTKSIKEHMVNLEDIAKDRSILQEEKEDLVKRLDELSDHYNRSIKTLKYELNMNISKLVETEKKYEEVVEDKVKLESKLESICSQLLESELHYKDMKKKLQQREIDLNEAADFKQKYEETKCELESEAQKLNEKIYQQNECLKDIQLKFEETFNTVDNLKCDLCNKEEYITELERKNTISERKLLESENKMIFYEDQLSSIKENIAQLRDDFGEFENLSDLHAIINEQRENFLKVREQNSELIEALKSKDTENRENIAQLKSHLEQNEITINKLRDKDEQNESIITLLRNNFEMRTQADIELNHQLNEKDRELNFLFEDLKTKKQGIKHLEEVISAMEDQIRNSKLQKHRDQERIKFLENMIADKSRYYTKNERTREPFTDDLDNLIDILENELENPYETQLVEGASVTKERKEYCERNELRNFEYKEVNKASVMEHKTKSPITTKVVTGNLNRKKAVTNIDPHKIIPSNNREICDSDTSIKVNNFTPYKDTQLKGRENGLQTRNLPFIIPSKRRDEKNNKMFKFAGHRI